ncbi:MAG TPA: hypothetical protein VIM04_12280 [Candidatus Binatia bacterium]
MEFIAEAGFLFRRLFPIRKFNADPTEPLLGVVVHSDPEPIVVNPDIPAVENPEAVFWIDPVHPKP